MMKYRAAVPYEYTHKGVAKTGWTEVGVAFKLKSGEGFSVVLRPNISISGRLVILGVEQNPEQSADSNASNPIFDYGKFLPGEDELI